MAIIIIMVMVMVMGGILDSCCQVVIMGWLVIIWRQRPTRAHETSPALETARA